MHRGVWLRTAITISRVFRKHLLLQLLCPAVSLSNQFNRSSHAFEVAVVVMRRFKNAACNEKRRYADHTCCLMVDFRELTSADYDEVVALWRVTEGVVLRDVDEREPIARYLTRNPGLSFVASHHGRVIGAVLCGTDGRRGYLQHLAVAPAHRRRGVGRALVQRCIDALAQRGLEKCHLMVLPQNEAARAFWRRLGWQEREDVLLMSHVRSRSPTA